MNKQQLSASMATQVDISKKHAHDQLSVILSTIHQALTEGEKVYIPQFGTFELRYHLAKQGRNPQTGETIEIAGFNQPSFKAAPKLKTVLNP
ncbi:HU family DNA-binding protein [Shewanella maritima]|uniref:HU family DNA-binding protein n=1 Tax=Shewanella maritima TaxID=2520507 RepID=UPI003736BB85